MNGKMTVKEIIEAVIRTLEQVSVRGKDDCDRMAGCIKALEMLNSVASAEPTKEETEQTVSNDNTEGING